MPCRRCGARAEELARTRKYVWYGCRKCLQAWRDAAPAQPEPELPAPPANRTDRAISIVRGTLISVGAVALAFVLRFSLQPWMGSSSPFLLFTPAVMIAAFYAGISGGVLATVLSALAGSRFFLAALAGEPAIERWDRIALFILIGALITTLSAVLDDARRQLAHSVWRQQKARAEAEAANQAKDEFLALVSHELQTPASVVLGWVSVIRSRDLTGDALAHALEIVERNAKLESRLIADVLDTSRIANGAMRLDCEHVDLAPIVRSAVDQMRPTLEARQLQLDVSVAGQRWPIEGDPIRLQQVFTNLLSNAAKFTPPGGRVSVALSRAGANAIVQVSDTGIGIAPDFVARVFDRFEQEAAGLTFSRNGLGLGLSICRYLVEQHGGEISARSAGRDQGATFVVQLPLSTRDDDHTAPPHGRVSVDALLATSVLLVEDDDDTRALLAATLKRYGATVEACRSATEAELSLATRRYDVLLCDLHMAHTDGLTFIRRVRRLEDPRRASIPAASITASAHAEERDRALAAGFQLHLEKPIAPDDLAAAMLALKRPPPHATAH